MIAAEDTSTDKLTTKAWPSPFVSSVFKRSAKLSRRIAFLTKAIPRSSRRWRSLSSGSMTVKRDLSNLKCRSMSGNTPRPIEPKPIMTIGPEIVPCTGHCDIGFLRKSRGAASRVHRYKKQPRASSQRPLARLEYGTGTLFDGVIKPRDAIRKLRDALEDRARQRLSRSLSRLSMHHFFEPKEPRFIDGAGKSKLQRM